MSTGTTQSPVSRIAAQTSAGTCTTSRLACAFDAECGVGYCIRPPGQCVKLSGHPCNFGPNGEVSGPGCPSGEFCRSPGGPIASCYELGAGDCSTNADCEATLGGGAECEEFANTRADEVVAPIVPAAAGETEDGRVQAVSSGLCVETLATACATQNHCAGGESCGPSGSCQRQHETCDANADCCPGEVTCPPNIACITRAFATVGAPDRDFDGVSEPLDNCVGLANPSQGDDDHDGLGNDRDLYTCGNGWIEGPVGRPGSEECDDGNHVGRDGCSAACQSEGPCDDNVDNDGDGLVDYDGNGNPALRDPGCRGAAPGYREDPQCNNGLDDDGDLLVDLADPQCSGPTDDDERTVPPPAACGLLGAEPVLALLALGWHRRLRRNARGARWHCG